MRYTHYRGLSQFSNRMKLNLLLSIKKIGIFEIFENADFFILSLLFKKELGENREFFIKYCFNSFLKAILAFRSHRGLQKRNKESG